MDNVSPTKFIPADDDGFENINAPCAVSIIEAIESDHTFILNEAALSRILLNPKVADKKVLFNYYSIDRYSHFQVAIISVSGAFRKGKSFLLNFFLRHLQNEEVSVAALFYS